MDWITYEGLELIGDKIIVMPDNPAEKTASGIIISPILKNDMLWGTVLATGKGRWVEDGAEIRREPLIVRSGDKVLFRHFTELNFKVVNKVLLIMREDDILAYKREDK